MSHSPDAAAYALAAGRRIAVRAEQPGGSVGAGTVATALGVVVLLTVLRAWLGSILWAYGDAGGETSPVDLALFGLIPVALALLVGPLGVLLVGARRMAVAGGLVLVVGTVVFQATDGGDPQAIAGTVAVTGAFVWLAAVAAGAVPAAAAAVGVVAGAGFDAVLHAGLRSVDLVWRSGPLAWIASLALLTAAAVAWVTTLRADDGAPYPGRAAPWAALPPVLAVIAVVAPVSRIHVLAGGPEWLAVAVVAAAWVAATAAAGVLVREPSRLALVGATGLATLGLAATAFAEMPFETPAILVGGAAAVIIGLGALLSVIGWPGAARGPAARAAVVGLGWLALFVVTFGYYAGYDMSLPVDQRVALLIGLGLAAALILWARPSVQARPAPATVVTLSGGLVIAGVLATVLVASTASVPEPVSGGGFPVRVMTYNVHNGFDNDGSFDLADLADVIRAEDPDVVALQEVARGWFTDGNTDVLPILAQEVGLPYVFAPAADDVWGNAVLSRYPVVDVRNDPLPRGETAMARAALSLVVELGDRQLGVVATHLHQVEEDVEIRREQAGRVAEIAADFIQSGLPVVVMGDLNAEPGSRDLEPLEDRLANVSAALGATATYPANAPDELIDHILVSSQLVGSDLAVPASTASDHLGVALTLELVP